MNKHYKHWKIGTKSERFISLNKEASNIKKRMKRSVIGDNYFDHEYKRSVQTYSRTRTVFHNFKAPTDVPADNSTWSLRKFVMGKIIDHTDKLATEKYQTRYVPTSIL